jgi:type VI secretion system lysozyme-like protein
MARGEPAREPRPLAGARTPLFARLAARGATAPARVLDRAGVVASIALELARLCNTRRPGPVQERALWVLDYGVPDFGGRSPASASDREAYARELERAIAAFEPRLQGIQVALEAAPPAAEQPGRLLGQMRAELRLGSVREPVLFPLLLEGA